MDVLPRPAALFDREAEWMELARFTSDASVGATLAVLYGRRRQGKTLMLELLAEATGGFMFTGLEQSSTQNLAALGRAYAAFRGLGAPVAFADWEQALEALLALGEDGRPLPVILDELPYLIRTAPEIPSLVQRALSPRGRARTHSRTRLVLCGSAFAVMGRLLSGTAALRGRASCEIVIHPFGFRESASFWGVDSDLDLAFRLHALVGGTPAYRDFCLGDLPATSADLDPWVVRHLLNPSSAFFREGRTLIAEEPEISELSLYFSVLAAIASGSRRRTQIALALGRKESALSHPLTLLEEMRLIQRRRDPLRPTRTIYHICEPMLRFHQLVIAPNEARLVRRDGQRVWAGCADTVSSLIYGPHFEELAREWTMLHATPATLGGTPRLVGSTEIDCPSHRRRHEIDVLVTDGDRALALGEAKWRPQAVGPSELERLRHLRDLLGPRRSPSGTRLLLFSRSGFTPELISEARGSAEVQLVDLERLYTGD